MGGLLANRSAPAALRRRCQTRHQRFECLESLVVLGAIETPEMFIAFSSPRFSALIYQAFNLLCKAHSINIVSTSVGAHA